MTDIRFRTVTVLGAGTMGAGIAQVAAQAGSRVILQDIKQEFVDKGMQRVRDSLAIGVQKQKVTQEQADATLSRMTATTDRVAAAKEADLVIEAVPEILDLKNSIFRELAANCRTDCVLATNTSSLSLQKVFLGVHVPERCIGLHWFNPPPIMKLLEVVRTSATSQDTIDAAMAFAAQCGKEPILVKDSPGFASSRLGVCLGLEAIRMVEAGVASPEDIDKAMVLGYRHPVGPLRLTDMVGLDVRMAIGSYLAVELGNPAFEPPQLMRDMVADGRLGKKAGRGFYDWG